MAKTRKMPAPFKFRGRWRAQVTLANANTEHDPELGGPTQATLAQALKHYAGLYTVNKGGLSSELNRINHYLVGAGMKPLRKTTDASGAVKLMPNEPGRLPKGWQAHGDGRSCSGVDCSAGGQLRTCGRSGLRLRITPSPGLSVATAEREKGPDKRLSTSGPDRHTRRALRRLPGEVVAVGFTLSPKS